MRCDECGQPAILYIERSGRWLCDACATAHLQHAVEDVETPPAATPAVPGQTSGMLANGPNQPAAEGEPRDTLPD